MHSINQWKAYCFREKEYSKFEWVKTLIKEYRVQCKDIAQKYGEQVEEGLKEHWFLNISHDFEADLREHGINLQKCAPRLDNIH